ncbi:hypothetical protein CALCODRAFT_503540 [Calocera cornea HHB12733]|uniref:Uncharacterized protein n=1 Tax=Calocera cornea HHB12733 TaxID=1353952 RepID=A0A165CUI4_9BASI|nr:hypothetical protein CALCODRAFT_503540 [Calocera cornea HHB12733]
MESPRGADPRWAVYSSGVDCGTRALVHAGAEGVGGLDGAVRPGGQRRILGFLALYVALLFMRM